MSGGGGHRYASPGGGGAGPPGNPVRGSRARRGGREPAGSRAPEVRGSRTPGAADACPLSTPSKAAHPGSPGARGSAARPRPLQVGPGQVRRPGFSQAQLRPPRIRRSSRRPEVAPWSLRADRGASRGPRTPARYGNQRRTPASPGVGGGDFTLSASGKIAIAVYLARRSFAKINGCEMVLRSKTF